ncbi:hypothetical protein BH23ACT6_BH23ACT6_18820 [soil metagenome]
MAEAEGSGTVDAASTRPRRFVVQRHRASRLHYDLRFEIDGALVSWAVPKGPTLDSDVRRLAIHVEDHALDYLDFEGVLPGNGYGAGDVIVWDIGTWKAYKSDDPARELANGELHAQMYGEKLRGQMVLVRTGMRQGKEWWLLLHKHDEYAEAGWDAEDHPRSVLTGRTNEQVQSESQGP